jgi:DNA-binding response OmpR family regulator
MNLPQTIKDTPLALIIEDDIDQATLFSIAMKGAGYSVHLAYDGQMARQWLDEHVPNMVLLDLNLPHVSGTTLLEGIKLDARFDDTKIIIVSAIGMYFQFLQEDVELILNKPVSLIQLQALSARFIC